MSLETIIIQFSYVAIFLFLYINGIIGFPSSQLVYILAGWFVFRGDLNLILILVIGIIAHFLGNITLYELSRINGLKYIKKIDNFCQKYYKLKIFAPKEIKKIQLVMKKKGLWYLFFGKLVNPIKLVINIPAGLSKVNRFLFGLIILITSSIWGIIFVSLGYFFGKSFDLAAYYGVIMLIFAVVLIYFFKKSMDKVANDVMEE